MPCPYMSLSVYLCVCVWSCAGSAAAEPQSTAHPSHSPPPTHTHTHTFVWPLSVAANRSQAPPKNCATMRDVDVSVGSVGSNVCRNLAGPQGRQARKERKKNVT